MSRSEREAKMKALLGRERYGELLITELGGRKRDRKKMVMDGLERAYREGSLPEYQEGNIPAYARSPMIESSRKGVPSWMHRKVMNAFPTLFGLGVGVARGAEFGPGPEDSIIARFEDESGTVDPQTLGEVMVLPERHSGKTIQQHELGHVSQGRYLGPFLPAAAGAASTALSLLGRDHYMESPFEVSAMEMGEAEASGDPTPDPMLRALRQNLFGK